MVGTDSQSGSEIPAMETIGGDGPPLVLKRVTFDADQYRESLGPRFDEGWWRPRRELSLLDCVLQFGWSIAEQLTRGYAHMVLHWSLYGDWWEERVRRGARWLGGA